MDFHVRYLVIVLAFFASGAMPSRADDAPAKSATNDKAADYSDPKRTYQTYIEAVRRNDLKAAKECYVIDDDNKSGALDVIVGLWISMRRLDQLAEKKFGDEAFDAIPRGWCRGDLSDRALDLTKKRLETAEVKAANDSAELKIKWQHDDVWAFEFGDDPRPFRKVNGNWKLDANKETGLKHGADFFEKGTWGPMFRDQMVIMNEANSGMEKGNLKTAKELKTFIDQKIAKMIKKYEDEAGIPGAKDK